MEQPVQPTSRADPDLRLLVVVDGSLAAAFTPYWIHWLRSTRYELAIRVARTMTTRAYVTRPSLQMVSGGPLINDVSESVAADNEGLHAELAQWADAFLICPATPEYIRQIVEGEGDTPSLRAIEVSDKPVIIAPSARDGTALQGYSDLLDALGDRPGVTVISTDEPAGSGRTFDPLWSMTRISEAIDSLIAAKRSVNDAG